MGGRGRKPCQSMGEGFELCRELCAWQTHIFHGVVEPCFKMNVWVSLSNQQWYIAAWKVLVSMLKLQGQKIQNT